MGPAFWNLLAALSGAGCGVIVSRQTGLRFMAGYLIVGSLTSVFAASEICAAVGLSQLTGASACFICGFGGLPVLRRLWDNIRPDEWASRDGSGVERHL